MQKRSYTPDEESRAQLYLMDLESRFKALDKTLGLENYYLSYSGGKDSHFLLWFIKEMLIDENITIVACNTTMEHPEIRERMYKNADVVLQPELTPMEIKEKYGSPCFSKIQDDFIYRYQSGCRSLSLMERIEGKSFIGKDGKSHRSSFNLNKTARTLLLSGQLHPVSSKCCTYLKKTPFQKYEKQTGKKAILGVRAKESKLRSAMYKGCLHKTGRFTPLWDMDSELMDIIYDMYDIEIPPIYDYVDRTGCMGCPYGSKYGETAKELDLLTPPQRRYVTSLFEESYRVLGVLKTDEDIQL